MPKMLILLVAWGSFKARVLGSNPSRLTIQIKDHRSSIHCCVCLICRRIDLFESFHG